MGAEKFNPEQAVEYIGKIIDKDHKYNKKAFESIDTKLDTMNGRITDNKINISRIITVGGVIAFLISSGVGIMLLFK